MKLLVFSDSHSHLDKIKEAIELHKAKCDCILFLGDGIKDIEYIKEMYPQIPFFYVKGNCDLMAQDVDTEMLLSLDNFKILITHGHKYGVKGGLGTLAYRARELDADAVFFGHTHVPFDNIIEVSGKNIHLFNPGSIGYEGYFGVVNTSGRVLIKGHGKLQ